MTCFKVQTSSTMANLNLWLNRHAPINKLCLASCALLTCGSLQAEIIAYDMANSLGSSQHNLDYHLNLHAGAFTSGSDGFERYTFNSSNLNELPAGLIDLTGYGRLDEQGLQIPDGHTLFGAVDSVNQNNPSGYASALWAFDIGYATDLSISAKFAAMGDFESNDTFSLKYSYDQDTWFNAFDFKAQTQLSQNYVMTNGHIKTLNDPMSIEVNNNGIAYNLNNIFSKYQADLEEQVLGLSQTLYVEFSGYADGGTEAIAMSDLIINGQVLTAPPPVLPLPVSPGPIVPTPVTNVSEPSTWLLYALPLLTVLVRSRQQGLS